MSSVREITIRFWSISSQRVLSLLSSCERGKMIRLFILPRLIRSRNPRGEKKWKSLMWIALLNKLLKFRKSKLKNFSAQLSRNPKKPSELTMKFLISNTPNQSIQNPNTAQTAKQLHDPLTKNSQCVANQSRKSVSPQSQEISPPDSTDKTTYFTPPSTTTTLTPAAQFESRPKPCKTTFLYRYFLQKSRWSRYTQHELRIIPREIQMRRKIISKRIWSKFEKRARRVCYRITVLMKRRCLTRWFFRWSQEQRFERSNRFFRTMKKVRYLILKKFGLLGIKRRKLMGRFGMSIILDMMMSEEIIK